MPSLPALSLSPPSNWQDFEDLCCDLMRRVWHDPYTQKNGRSGQSQKGVDISGQPNQEADWAGMQCKLRNSTSGRLTLREVKKEIEQARIFQPQLKRLVVATTSPRDASLQAKVRVIDEAERQDGSFSVSVLFWEDIVSMLRDYPELARKYYPRDFLPHDSSGHGTAKPARDAQRFGLEFIVELGPDTGYVGLIPAFSSIPQETPDLAYMSGGLDIEIINHDDSPTEIRRLWLDLEGYSGLAPEVKEEGLTGNRWIEARRHGRFILRFAAVFQDAPPEDWQQRIVLCVKATGFEELRQPLKL